MRSKSGDSATLARMNQPTSSSTTLARNGMRQPQDSMSLRAARRLRPWPARTGSGPAPRRSAAGCRRSPSCLRARARRPSGWRRPIRRRPPRPAGSASAPAARRPSSRCCRRRDQADQDGGDAHHEERDEQHGLASDLVAEVAEHHAAAAGEEADGIGGKGGQGAADGIDGGKEDLVEDQGRGGAVQEKSYHSMVVPIMLASPAVT